MSNPNKNMKAYYLHVRSDLMQQRIAIEAREAILREEISILQKNIDDINECIRLRGVDKENIQLRDELTKLRALIAEANIAPKLTQKPTIEERSDDESAPITKPA